MLIHVGHALLPYFYTLFRKANNTVILFVNMLIARCVSWDVILAFLLFLGLGLLSFYSKSFAVIHIYIYDNEVYAPHAAGPSLNIEAHI